MVDWHVFSTEDMSKWTDHGVAFSLKDISWASEEAWAPDCIERNGKYFFYFPAGGQIGVAVSDCPTGPFKDALSKPMIKSKEAGIRYMIDPCVFLDDDGQAYLYIGGGRQLGVVKLKEDMVTRDGPIQILAMPKFYEGVWVHKRNGIYYASYPTRPEDRDSQANVMVYSMAKSPLGPWEYKGELLDNRSHNVHGSITEFKGQWYLFYHVEGPSHWERRVCVEPLFYNEDGTIKPMQMSKSKTPGDSAGAAKEHRRLCVLTDIGGDPDDQQSMVRLMVYANEFQIEGLIASASGTPGELKKAVTRPDLIREIVSAYRQVRSNLVRHAEGWPNAEELAQCIKSGNPQRGREHIGESHDTEASRWLIERVDAGSAERPLNIAIWGGQTDLAQALWRVKHDRGADGLAQFVRRFCVFDIADQDGIADWMRAEFPGMNYILSAAPPGRDKREATFRGMYLGGDESLTSGEWTEANVRSKGPLGALYPMNTHTPPNPHGCMKEGDTPSWFFFLPLGGNDPADPAKPGWGGQYEKSADGWWRDIPSPDPGAAVYRWRPEFQADFARRMRWCIQ